MIGKTLLHYEITARIGAGGMGEVYRARDRKLEREVAVKILPEGLRDHPDRLERFEHEARAVAALSHPNILAIHDYGVHDGIAYAVAELLEGTTLGERLSGGALPAHRAAEFGAQIARGLAAAHDKGIVHRDLNPGNVFLTKDGHVKILDFGLATDVRSEGNPSSDTTATELTKPGTLVGTVGYMSPEQVRGERAGPGSDIFAVGVLLYEMLTGQRAFRRDTSVETMNAILNEEPPDPIETERAIPPVLDRIVRHCLEKRPEERFRSARDLAFQLESITGDSSGAGRVAATSPRPRVARDVAVVLAVLSAGLLALIYLEPPGADLSAYRFTPFATDAEAERWGAWSPDGRSIAYERWVDGIPQVFVRSLDADAPVQLTHGRFACCPGWAPDGNRVGFATPRGLWTVGRAGGEPELFRDGPIRAADLSPDGGTLAFWRSSARDVTAGVWLASPPAAEARLYAPSPFEVTNLTLDSFAPSAVNWPVHLRFSPDGTRILTAFRSDVGEVEVWLLPFPDGSAARDKPRRVFLENPPWNWTPFFSWMPDSRRVVMSGHVMSGTETSNRVRLWMADVESGSLVPLTAGIENESLPSVSPDGSRIVFTSGTTDFDLVEVPLDGSPVRDLLATSRRESFAAWVPGLERFVYVTDRSGRWELRVRTRIGDWDRPVVSASDFPRDPSRLIFGPTVSPDGTRVAYARLAPDGAAIWVSPISGGAPAPAVQTTETNVAPTWSPDGRWLAIRLDRDGMNRLAKVRPGGTDPPQVLVETANPIGIPAWSPSGEWIAYRDHEGVYLVSPEGEGARLLLQGPGGALVWSRDNRWLYTVVPDAEGGSRLIRVDVADGGVEPITRFGAELRFATPASPGQRFSLAPDGLSFLASVARDRSDLWILEGFDQPRGILGWLR